MTRYFFNHWEITPAGGVTTSYPQNPLDYGPIAVDTTIVAVYVAGTHTITFTSAPITNVTYTQPSGAGGGNTTTVVDGSTITIQVPSEVTV